MNTMTPPQVALDRLMVLTSYETFSALRLAGRSEQRIIQLLQDSAQALLLDPA